MATQTAPEPTKITIADLERRDRIRLESVMEKYNELGAKIDLLKEQQETLKKEKIIPLHAALGVDVIREREEGDGGWYIALRSGRNSTDKEKVVRYLTDHGVDPKLTVKAFAIATTQGKPFIEVDRGLRGKKRGGE